MASRDLTRKFAEFRSARPRKAQPTRRGEQAEMLSAAGYSTDASEDCEAPAAPSLPPVWVDTVDAVEVDVGKIEKNFRELQGLHTKRLMVSFDERNEEALDANIDDITRGTTKLFRSCEQALKRIGREADSGELSQSECTVRHNIQSSMARKLQTLNTEFRTSQREYMRRLQQQKATGGSADASFDFLSGGGARDGDDCDDGSSGRAGSGGFNQSQMTAVVDLEAVVAERDVEVRKIAESIQELSTIFKELAVLVIDQGTILDRIDFNMEQVAEHTRKGVVEIEQAEQYQKAARPRMCILLLLLLITVMLVALILKHQGGSSKSKKR